MTTQLHEGGVPEWTMGDRLRKARSLTGMTTREFAEEIGVSQKTINNVETDKHTPRKIVVNAYALATKVSVRWLETGLEEVTGPNPEGDPSGVVTSPLLGWQVAA